MHTAESLHWVCFSSPGGADLEESMGDGDARHGSPRLNDGFRLYEMARDVTVNDMSADLEGSVLQETGLHEQYITGRLRRCG